MELNFYGEGCTVDVVEEKEIIVGDYNTYILTPTLKEWKLLFACFSVYDEYVTAN